MSKTNPSPAKAADLSGTATGSPTSAVDTPKPLRSGVPGRLELQDFVPEEQQVSHRAKWWLGGYLIATLAASLGLMLVYWPDNVPAGEGVGISHDRNLIGIAILAGSLGACIHALQSLGAFLGERTMMRSWIPWYYLRPFLGMGLAVMAFFVLAGGLVQGNTGALSPYGVAAIGALAGLFSRRAIQKLAEVCDTLFQLKREEERSGKLDGSNQALASAPSRKDTDTDPE